VDATRSEPPAGSPRFSRAQLRVAVAVPVVAMLVVLAIRLWLKWVGPLSGDRWALEHASGMWEHQSLVDAGDFFSAAGTPLVAGLTGAWIVLFVWRSDGLRGVAFVVLAAAGVGFNQALKELSGPTPLMIEKAGSGLNYPSGHTVYAVTVFGAVAWLAWRHRRFAIAAAFAFLIVLMGPFRVIADAHFVSDVVAAYFVGLGWLVPAAILTGHGRANRPPGQKAESQPEVETKPIPPQTSASPVA
jgi:undecaprenyl-diphosphatase